MVSLLQTPKHCKRSQTTTPPIITKPTKQSRQQASYGKQFQHLPFQIVFNHVLWTHLTLHNLFLDPHTRRVTPWTCFILVFQWLILKFVMLPFLMWFLTLPKSYHSLRFSRCFNSSTARTFSDVYTSTQTPNAVKALWWIGWYFLTVSDTLDSIALLRLQRSKVMKKVQPK